MYLVSKKTGYDNVHEEKAARIIYELLINIGGLDFLFDIVVAKTR